MRSRLALATLLAMLAAAAPARAQTPIWMLAQSLRARAGPAVLAIPRGALSPGERCRAAISRAEAANRLPPHLLAAIGRVESGRRAADGQVDPWPWSINVEGTDHVYETEGEAIAAVRGFQAAGTRSIDVGCLQVNLMYHPDVFVTLEDAFDPERNAAYAARFLVQLQARTGDWDTATAWYHSATPALGEDYRRRVMASLPEERQRAGSPPLPPGAPAAGPGPFMLGNNARLARLILAPPGGAGAGRGLAAYRSAPVLVASRVALR